MQLAYTAPVPAGQRAPYRLLYESVDDHGALPPRVLRSRRVKEEASTKAFQEGALMRMTQLAELHAFIYGRHSAYTASGMLSKKALNASSALAQTY